MKNTKKNEAQNIGGIDAEIAKLLYGSHNSSLLASIIVVFSLLVIQYDLVGPIKSLLWAIIIITAYSLRSLLVARFYKNSQKNQTFLKWLQKFRIHSGLCGLSWGMAGILLFPKADIAHQAFLIFALVGVSGGAAIVYSIDTSCSNLFIAGLLIPTISQLIIIGNSFTVATSILFIVFNIYITVAGRNLAKSVRDNIKLRIAASWDSEKVHKLAYYDELTSLPNRRLLSDHLTQTFIDCERLNSYGALLYLDLDDFKNINDLRGHQAGDQLLQLLSQRLQEKLHDSAFIARVGGDEFVIVVNDLGGNKLKAKLSSRTLAEELIHIIAKPFLMDGYYYNTSPSIGICVFMGKEFNEAEALRRADVAMYQAKRISRKNTLQFYDDSQNSDFHLRAAIESDLKLALKKQQLSLHYQVQVDENETNIGAEILLRWNHPALGSIPPCDFIHVAEESGEIINIGSWVLTQACKQLSLWEKSPTRNKLKLSVNVSALQFNQPDFVDTVIKIIKATKCNPRLLKIELTESLFLQNMKTVINKMNLLRNEGVTFSLDDFGTGYSSLSILKELPLDELKIDASFIRELHSSSGDQFITQTIIAMGVNLGLSVIAEGVETEEQKKQLEEYGCHIYQGFLFGKPMKVHDLEATLEPRTEETLVYVDFQSERTTHL